MHSFKNLTLGAAAGALAIFLVAGGSALAQQNEDQIRAKCISEVVKLYPDANPDSMAQYQNARVELYKTCMIKHGLKP